MPRDALARIAYEQLAGVGDSSLGEWTEMGEIAFHLRRRLTASEEATVGPAVDVRGTWESTKRRAAVDRFVPPGYPEV